VGLMGGIFAHEFMYITNIGEDSLILCNKCGYKANRQVARFNKEQLPPESPKELKKVNTPGAHTIEKLAGYLNIPRNKTAKAVFFVANIQQNNRVVEKFIFAVIRGDMELNETKLLNALQAKDLRPARDDEIQAIGTIPGFASPVGLNNVFIIVDDIIPSSPNLVSGANETDYHFLNVNYPRDFSAPMVVDIVCASEGHACPECGSPLSSSRGVEVGNIFKLGTHYSKLMKCDYLARDGSLRPVYMGSYGIGIGRLLACIVEQHHDQNGIIWPVSVAPYQIHLLLLRGKGDNKSESNAEMVYQELKIAGLEVLYDDGFESPGVKFSNADLIGCPIRITISYRASAAGGVEFKLRHQEDRSIVAYENVVQYAINELYCLNAEISESARNVSYDQ